MASVQEGRAEFGKSLLGPDRRLPASSPRYSIREKISPPARRDVPFTPVVKRLCIRHEEQADLGASQNTPLPRVPLLIFMAAAPLEEKAVILDALPQISAVDEESLAKDVDASGSTTDDKATLANGLEDQTAFLPAKQVIVVFLGLSVAVACSFLEQTMCVSSLLRANASRFPLETLTRWHTHSQYRNGSSTYCVGPQVR